MIHKIMRSLAAFFLTLCIAAVAAILLLYFVGLSPSGIKRSFSQSNYYESLATQTIQSTASILIPSGVTGEVLEGTLPKADVEVMVNNSLGQASEAEYTQVVDKISERLQENIKNYIAAQGLNAAEYTKEIDEITEFVLQSYEQSTSFPFGKQLVGLQGRLGSVLLWAIGACVVVGVLAVLVLFRGRRSTALRYTAYTLIGAGLVLLVLPLALRISAFYARVQLQPQYFYNFFVQHIHNVLGGFILVGAIMLALGVLIAVRHELNRRHRRHTHR